MNPKEGLRSVGRVMTNPVRWLYRFEERWFRENHEQFLAQARAQYLETMVNRERMIFNLLYESNSLLPHWKRKVFSEEVKREHTEFFDTKIREIVDAAENLHEG